MLRAQENFCRTPQRLALLIACDYTTCFSTSSSDKNALNLNDNLNVSMRPSQRPGLTGAASNDVELWRQALRRDFGFAEEDIFVLTEENRSQPTKKNCLHYLKTLLKRLRPGDVFFLAISGCGTAVSRVAGAASKAPPDESSCEQERYTAHESRRIATGFVTSPDRKMIYDDEFRETFDSHMPPGVLFTAVLDFGYAGEVASKILGLAVAKAVEGPSNLVLPLDRDREKDYKKTPVIQESTTTRAKTWQLYPHAMAQPRILPNELRDSVDYSSTTTIKDDVGKVKERACSSSMHQVTSFILVPTHTPLELSICSAPQGLCSFLARQSLLQGMPNHSYAEWRCSIQQLQTEVERQYLPRLESLVELLHNVDPEDALVLDARYATVAASRILLDYNETRRPQDYNNLLTAGQRNSCTQRYPALSRGKRHDLLPMMTTTRSCGSFDEMLPATLPGGISSKGSLESLYPMASVPLGWAPLGESPSFPPDVDLLSGQSEHHRDIICDVSHEMSKKSSRTSSRSPSRMVALDATSNENRDTIDILPDKSSYSTRLNLNEDMNDFFLRKIAEAAGAASGGG
ncbi:unnamed protein product [Amoebophrya sp. A25]|nr:unnamed protein product [Amoebophrya sp. A25]|eukprot:GSA25T00014083001.1